MEKITAPDHEAAVRLIVEQLPRFVRGRGRPFDAVGHRVVHGGDLFAGSVAIDDNCSLRSSRLNDLAPLHNPVR